MKSKGHFLSSKLVELLKINNEHEQLKKYHFLIMSSKVKLQHYRKFYVVFQR